MPAIALVAGVAGLVVLLLLLAAPVITAFVRKVVPSIGIPGTSINLRDSIANAVASSLGALTTLLDDATIPVGFILQGVALTLWWAVGVVTNALLTAITTAQVAGGSIVAAVHTAEQFAAQEVHTAELAALHLYDLAVKHADALAADVERDARALASHVEQVAIAGAHQVLADAQHYFNVSIAHADSLAAALSVEVDNLARTVSGDVTGLVAQLTAAIASAAAAATAQVDQALATAEAAATSIAAAAAGSSVTALEGAVHDVVSGPWEALLPEVVPIIGALDPSVVAGLHLPQVLPGSLPVSLPAILGLVVPVVGALAAEVNTCLVGKCATLSELDKLLGGLRQLGVAALLFGLLGAAVADPEAAAAAIVDAGSWLDGALTGLTDAVLG